MPPPVFSVIVARSALTSKKTGDPSLVPSASYDPSGSLRTSVIEAAESLAWTAATTLSASSPVTAVSCEPPI